MEFQNQPNKSIENYKAVIEIPSFLWETPDGKLVPTVYGEGPDDFIDITDMYKNYINSLSKKPIGLPSFLFEKEEHIFMGVDSDTDITNEWNKWVKSLS